MRKKYAKGERISHVVWEIMVKQCLVLAIGWHVLQKGCLILEIVCNVFPL